jgi:hypothetical protein
MWNLIQHDGAGDLYTESITHDAFELSFWRCDFSFSHTKSIPNVNENLHKLTLIMLLLPHQVINIAKSIPIPQKHRER